MNNESMPWYRVPEVWLILFLLAATVIGSLALVVTAARNPDLLPAKASLTTVISVVEQKLIAS